MNLLQLAKLCHSAINDFKFLIMKEYPIFWDDAEQWMVDDTIGSIEMIVSSDNPTYDMLHNHWMDMKVSAGWSFGEVTDRPNKIHNCIIPFDELSPEEQAKDKLFVELVLTYKPFIDNL